MLTTCLTFNFLRKSIFRQNAPITVFGLRAIILNKVSLGELILQQHRGSVRVSTEIEKTSKQLEKELKIGIEIERRLIVCADL